MSTYPSVTPTGEDPSVAFTCLLKFDWFDHLDMRTGDALVAMLTEEWRKRVFEGSMQGCYEIAEEIQLQLIERADELEGARWKRALDHQEEYP